VKNFYPLLFPPHLLPPPLSSANKRAVIDVAAVAPFAVVTARGHGGGDGQRLKGVLVEGEGGTK